MNLRLKQVLMCFALIMTLSLRSGSPSSEQMNLIEDQSISSIRFINNDYDNCTLTIWYSDWNNQWDLIHTEHMPSGTEVVFQYEVGKLQYYGYSIDGGRTIYSINTNFIYL